MRFLPVLFMLFFVPQLLFGQSEKLRLNLDDSGETYIKAAFRGQFWTRYTAMNPGSHVDKDTLENGLDFSIRRIRFGLAAQLSKRVYVFVMMGNNNLNERTEAGFVIDMLDYYAEYRISDALEIGMGESAWGGQSRWNIRSTLSYMALDAPLFSLSTVNKNDDLGRMLGVWAKGQIGKFDYVVALKEPSVFGVEPQEGTTDYATGRENLRYSAYLKYEFLDDESNKTPFSGGTGTYLGQKRVFNLGVGMMHQKDMTSALVNGTERLYNFNSWTLELFYDNPINTTTGTALTSYLGYFHTDFGPEYIRNLGANNYTDGGTSFNGPGNAFPMMGTGDTYFFQLGYLLKRKEREHYTTQLQPNIAIQYSNFEKLGDPVVVYDLGINYYLKGHHNKFTLGLQNRPVFFEDADGSINARQRRSMWVLQYQISIN